MALLTMVLHKAKRWHMVELFINGYHLLVLCEVFVDIFPFLCAYFYYSFQVLGVFFVGFGGWLGWAFVYFIFLRSEGRNFMSFHI